MPRNNNSSSNNTGNNNKTKSNLAVKAIIKTAFGLGAGFLVLSFYSAYQTAIDGISVSSSRFTTSDSFGTGVGTVVVGGGPSSSSGSSSSSSSYNRRSSSPLDVPQGEAIALPSIRIPKEEVDRGIYGGQGDKKHLGGFTSYDMDGISPTLWKHMITNYGVKSLIDVGCGKGVSTLWFDTHGVDVLCVEGSHDAAQRSLLPHPQIQVVEHDFSRGPYWPSKSSPTSSARRRTYDAVWCVEFLEHVGRNFMSNYIPTFRTAALIFATHSQWGGWHHVEVHGDTWWINKMESFGFRYSQSLTDEVRQIARDERAANVMGPDGNPADGQHIWLSMQVFINPAVASLSQHAHLFSEPGCFMETDPGTSTTRHKECGTGVDGDMESKLPDSYYPLQLTPEQDDVWLQKVKQSIQEAAAAAAQQQQQDAVQ